MWQNRPSNEPIPDSGMTLFALRSRAFENIYVIKVLSDIHCNSCFLALNIIENFSQTSCKYYKVDSSVKHIEALYSNGQYWNKNLWKWEVQSKQHRRHEAIQMVEFLLLCVVSICFIGLNENVSLLYPTQYSLLPAFFEHCMKFYNNIVNERHQIMQTEFLNTLSLSKYSPTITSKFCKTFTWLREIRGQSSLLAFRKHQGKDKCIESDEKNCCPL